MAGLNLDRPEEQAEVRTFLGAGENIYASLQNLYATVTEYGIPVKAPNYAPIPSTCTSIYKFALDGGKINYLAKGKVPGTVLNQFSMDEYDGHFCLATTTENFWNGGDGASRNSIFILDEGLNLKGSNEDNQ